MHMLCRLIILTETEVVDSHALLFLVILVEFVINYYCEPICYYCK